MTNQEINEAVAKKLGHNEPFIYVKLAYCYTGHKYYPDYSGDIAAAWEIMETHCIALVPFQKRWYATSMDMPEREGECFEIWTQTNCATENECSCGRCAVADTAPLAICKAFLKLPQLTNSESRL